jgi:threo-3-hydroxy-L-aspartate ammonia-lyase
MDVCNTLSSAVMTTELAVAYEDVVAAHERIRAIAIRTPTTTSRTADAQAGASLYFKCELFQRMGAFKFRGAYNALARMTPEQRTRGVIAFSSGNHAQGIALAAQLLGMPATIVMPNDAPAIKVEATLGYGAEVIRYDRYTEDREALGKRIASERGLTLIPPYDHADIIAGQGTAAKELFEDAGPLDVLITPLGGGGLLSGSALAAKALAPGCRVIGVEPAAGNDGQRSFRAGEIVRIETPNTIADGAQTQYLGKLTFPIIRALVHDIETVEDVELVRTMTFFASRMKLVVEPTGCLAAAYALRGLEQFRGARIGVILSGGNVDLARFCELTGSTR